MTDRIMQTTILVHVARTWERVRLEMPNQEMPYDNIASVNEIAEIAKQIFDIPLIQEFLHEKDGSIWDRHGDGCSDVYIERCAREIIKSEYL